MEKEREQKGSEHTQKVKEYCSRLLQNLQEGTQNYMVLDYILKHGSITPIDAFFDLGLMRLGARIFDLRSMGAEIETEIVTIKDGNLRKKYARYWI